ncbi:hypothetical protein [Streptomyces sp. V3I7]|uniref:hypothetical protein n=1 Tax=Streptomyces sp. V3I7 TaxID=3042278 RepID=UPI0027853AEC|nr:hypothetical protein [Streptomyces sp. V3I7]MDQ0988774.1 hypothetical protein [Streptomyces sp. V3I7]
MKTTIICDRTVRFRNRAVVTVALGAALVLTACSYSDGQRKAAETSPAVSSTPASPSVDATQAAKAEVIASYRAYWKEVERVYANASVDGTDIATYAASAALVRAKSDSERLRVNGRLITGTVRVNYPKATVNLNRKIPNAKITSCLDVSRWNPVDKDTKKPAPLPSTRMTKYITVATLERWDDRWKVIRDEPQAGRAC